MKVAIIPARGGSKRVPRKNIREFCGKPIIAYSIEVALNSGCFDQVIVSTDDEEIAGIARQYGAETPFVRPHELANDHAGTIPVIKHAIEWLSENREMPEFSCCIYATTPFVETEDLVRGLELLQQSEAQYVFPVTSFASPIQRAMMITTKGRMKMFYPEQFNVRSQDLEPAFHDAAQFYWGRPEAFITETPIFSEGSAPLVVPRYRVVDIDTQEDWDHAELLYRALHNL